MSGKHEAHFVALEGTCCTGKTEAFKVLGARLDGKKGVRFITEAARGYLIENSLTIDVLYSFPVQALIQSLVLKSEEEALKLVPKPKVTVEDRSGLSAAVYVYSRGNKRGADILLQRVNSHTHDRTVLLFDPTGIPYAPDYLRRETPQERMATHEAYVDYFNRQGLGYTLVGGSLKNKIDTVAKVIYQHARG